MQSHSPPIEGGPLRTVRELALETRRGTETIRRHLSRGRIDSTKVGTVHAFTLDQWQQAVAYFRDLDREEVARRGDH